MNIKRIIFIRPGETDWNRWDRWQGWVAAPLNAHGRLQASALAGFLRNIGVGAIYSSDLKRAQDTTEVICERLGATPTYDPRLRERQIGEWQGMTLEEVKSWYPEEYAHLQSEWETYTIPGGESLRDVKARMGAAFAQILKDDVAETIGIVTHTVVIRALLSDLIAGYDPREARVGNTAVTTLMRDGEGDVPLWKIIVANDVMHLEGLESRSVKELEDKR